MKYAEYKFRRSESLLAWFKWYFHWRKFGVDNTLHVAIGLLALLPVALAADQWWAWGCSAALASIPREYGQWPPRRMPNGTRAYFDPIVDVLFFGLGGVVVGLWIAQ